MGVGVGGERATASPNQACFGDKERGCWGSRGGCFLEFKFPFPRSGTGFILINPCTGMIEKLWVLDVKTQEHSERTGL